MKMFVLALAAAAVCSAAPHFEVASIKRSKDCPPGLRSGGENTPGRLVLHCQLLSGMIISAYVRFADGRFTTQPRPVPISGGPSWIDSDFYDITAKAEGTPADAVMWGPMLQALLEDRFQLKIHRQTRAIPVYALVQSEGGAKLRPFVEGSCIPVDRSKFPPPPAASGNCHARGRRDGMKEIDDAQAMTVSEFSRIFLNGALDRPVIDQTGITGTFDFHLEYGIDEPTPRFNAGGAEPGGSAGPSIFTAVREQLGLRLISTTGPGESLVIDHVERPSEN